MQLQLYGKKIWIFRQPVDFRLSLDGLSNLVVNGMKQNPQAGIFIFYNKGKDKMSFISQEWLYFSI